MLGFYGVELMRIEYEIKFSDILLFNAIHQILSPAVQIFYLIIAVGIMLMELRYSQSGFFRVIMIGLIVYIAMWAVQLFFNIFLLYSKKDKAILTKHIIDIQDDALYEETKYNRSFFYWNGINKIVRRPGFIAVYVTKHMAHIIPARAFNSESERSEFFKCVKEKLSV